MITIIGGSGFIGTRFGLNLSEHQKNFCVVDKVLGNEFSDRTILADVRSTEQLRDAIPEHSTLVNLAAEHRDNVRPKRLYEEVNVTGAKNICQIAREMARVLLNHLSILGWNFPQQYF